MKGKGQIILFGGKGIDQILAGFDDLVFRRPDPDDIFISAVQKRLDLILVISGQNIFRTGHDLVYPHPFSLPKNFRIIHYA